MNAGAMRSKLFVPGSRPELFDKAWRSEADAVSFDLEDAVVADAKTAAREAVAAALDRRPDAGSKTAIVRINASSGAALEADMDAVVRPGLDVINVPKVDGPEIIRTVGRRLESLEELRGLKRRVGILVNIETPQGLRKAAEIAMASDRIIGLQLGFGDLFAPLGIERTLAAMGPVWLAVRLAAAEAGLPAYDAAYVRIGDLEGFRAEAEASRRLGFAGKSCVHPSQIAHANAVFSPTENEMAAARKVVEAAETMDVQRRRRLHGGGRHVRRAARDPRPRDRQAGG